MFKKKEIEGVEAVAPQKSNNIKNTIVGGIMKRAVTIIVALAVMAAICASVYLLYKYDEQELPFNENINKEDIINVLKKVVVYDGYELMKIF